MSKNLPADAQPPARGRPEPGDAEVHSRREPHTWASSVCSESSSLPGRGPRGPFRVGESPLQSEVRSVGPEGGCCFSGGAAWTEPGLSPARLRAAWWPWGWGSSALGSGWNPGFGHLGACPQPWVPRWGCRQGPYGMQRNRDEVPLTFRPPRNLQVTPQPLRPRLALPEPRSLGSPTAGREAHSATCHPADCRGRAERLK